MTRQVTDQLYIDLEYFTPEEYFIYVAEAQSALSSQASLSCNAGKIVSAETTINAAFTQTTYASRTKDIDLYAFGEAAIAVEISLIRDNNISVTSVFDIATDGRRLRDISAQEDAIFNIDIVNERSRAISQEMQVAFSFDAIAEIITPQGQTVYGNGAFTSSASIEIQAVKIAVIESAESSAFTLSALGSHYEGASLVAFGNSSLSVSVERIRSATASASSEFSLASTAEIDRSTGVELNSTSILTAINERNRNFESAESSAFTLSALGSHYEGASLVAFSNCNLEVSVDVIRDISCSLQTQVTCEILGGKQQLVSAVMNMGSFVLVAGYGLLERPRQYTLYNPDANNNVYIDTGTKKFGSGSLAITGSGYYQGYYSPDFKIGSDRFALETWIYYQTAGTTTGTKNLIRCAYGTSSYEAYSLVASYSANLPYLYFQWKDSTDTLRFTPVPSAALPSNQWVHVVVSRGNGRVSIFQNGTRIATTTTNESGSWAPSFTTNKPKFTILGASTSSASTPAFRFDDVSMTIGWDKDYNAAQSTITVPTTESRNYPVDTHYTNSQTKTLLHFNSNFNDDITADWRGAGALTVSATLHASLTARVTASAALNSAFTMSTIGSHYEGASLVAFANSAMTASVDKLKYADSALSTAVSMSVAGTVTKELSSNLTVSASEDIAYTRTRAADVSVQALASTLIAAAKVGDSLVILNSAATMSIQAVKIAGASSTQNLEFNTDIDAIKQVSAQATVISAFTESVQARLLKSTSVNQTSAFTESVIAGKTVVGGMHVVSLFDLIVDTSGIRNGAALIFSLGTLFVEAGKITNVATDLSSDFALSADTLNSLTKQFSADISATASLLESNTRTRNFESAMTMAAGELVATGKIGQGIISLAVTSDLNADAVIITDAAVDQIAEFAVESVNSRIRNTGADIASEFNLTAEGTTSKVTDAHLTVNSTLSAIANKNGEIRLVAFAGSTLNSSAVARRGAVVNVTSRVTTDTTAVRLRDTTVNLQTATDLMIRVTTLSMAHADLTTRFTADFDTSVLHITQYVYKIPAEDRYYNIFSENRTRSITGESREFIIGS